MFFNCVAIVALLALALHPVGAQSEGGDFGIDVTGFGRCVATMFTSCTYVSGDVPLVNTTTGRRRRRKRADVNCFADGTCVEKSTPNRDTCCGICASCTYNGCCHCSFIDPTKYCPIPGWRSANYTGDRGHLVPRNGLGGCGDPQDFSNRIFQYIAALFVGTLIQDSITGFLYNPYTRYNWSQVVQDARRPTDGQVITYRMPSGRQRVEFMERYLRPEDLRPRDSGSDFTSAQRQQWNADLDAQPGDQGGHILANTLGGSNSWLNYFPQHAGVNANVDSRWAMDSWVDTERAIREFLGRGIPGSYVLYRVTLIYPSTQIGRPSEIAWAAVFTDPAAPNQEGRPAMGGRVRNDGAAGNGPQGICRPSGGSG